MYVLKIYWNYIYKKSVSIFEVSLYMSVRLNGYQIPLLFIYSSKDNIFKNRHAVGETKFPSVLFFFLGGLCVCCCFFFPFFSTLLSSNFQWINIFSLWFSASYLQSDIVVLLTHLTEDHFDSLFVRTGNYDSSIFSLYNNEVNDIQRTLKYT